MGEVDIEISLKKKTNYFRKKLRNGLIFY